VLVDAARWSQSDDPRKRELGQRWTKLLTRQYTWKMVCERSLVFAESDQEGTSIFSEAEFVERRLRDALPDALRDVPLRVDLARHIHRPYTQGPASGQNYLYDSACDRVRPLSASELSRHTPVSHRICRIYAHNLDHRNELSLALDRLIGGGAADDLTNM